MGKVQHLKYQAHVSPTENHHFYTNIIICQEKSKYLNLKTKKEELHFSDHYDIKFKCFQCKTINILI